MFEADAGRRVSLRLQREEMTIFASKLAFAEEAQTLDVEIRSWFIRTYAKCENSLTDYGTDCLEAVARCASALSRTTHLGVLAHTIQQEPEGFSEVFARKA